MSEYFNKRANGGKEQVILKPTILYKISRSLNLLLLNSTMEQRTTGYVKLYTEEQKQRIKENRCPICNLHKDQWKRRKDWTCCSKECTEQFSKLFTSWQNFKHKAFVRDDYTCVKCGFVCPKDKYPVYPRQLDEKGELVYEYSENYDTREIIGDHIIPIALGGDEFDLDNIQTLCVPCNKIKTKQDMDKIAKQRRVDRALIMNKPLAL